MKLIINASGTKATGVTQVTVSFIRECIKFTENYYYVFMSQTLASQLDISDFPSNFIFYVFDYKPFFNLKGIRSWLRLIKLEKEIKPDCVFSVFGPSIWSPNSPHFMGYAYPYYVYPESPFFKVIPFKKRFIILLHKIFHKFFLQRNGSHYVCETEDVSARLPNYIKCNPENVYTVTNTYNDYFESYTPANSNFLPERKDKEFRFVTLSSFATHKNLTILNKVIPILKQRIKNYDVRFVLTVDEKLFNERMSAETRAQIYNLGRIKVYECPQVYFESDAMFLPTLMECFSASYAEAMKMGKPIITSKLPFATTVCNDAAIYFDPLNPEDIAEKMIELIEQKELQNKLVKNGYLRLKAFDSPSSRAEKYLSLCQKIVRNE